MVTRLTLLVLTYYVALFAHAQENAQCHFPRLTPRHGLNLNKIMGQWYLHEFAASDRGFDPVEPNFKCNQLNYVPDADFAKSGKFKSFESHKNSTSGKIEHFEVPITVPKMMSPVSSMWDAVTLNGDTKMVVLSIDKAHEKWFMLYSCSVFGSNKYRWETVGIWSRSRFLDPSLREILKDLLVGLGFPLQSHKFHSQEECFPVENKVRDFHFGRWNAQSLG